MKDEIKDLVQGGEQMLFNAILVSLSSIVAIIALVTILITK
jgi:hypothetical protein